MGKVIIDITDMHSINLDVRIITNYAFKFGEYIDTTFMREDICRDYDLINNDAYINKWIDTNSTSQQNFDKMMYDRFYEELHIGEIIEAAWQDKFKSNI